MYEHSLGLRLNHEGSHRICKNRVYFLEVKTTLKIVLGRKVIFYKKVCKLLGSCQRTLSLQNIYLLFSVQHSGSIFPQITALFCLYLPFDECSFFVLPSRPAVLLNDPLLFNFCTSGEAVWPRPLQTSDQSHKSSRVQASGTS